MIRGKAGRYLQRHFANRIYFNTNEPEDAIPISYSFESIKEETKAISNMLDKINVSDDIITKKFCAIITHFDRKSDQAESYCEPPEVIRQKEYQRCLLRNFIRLKDTKKAKQVLVIERCFLDDLGSDFRKTHIMSCVGNRLFKKKGSTTIFILVMVSYHVIAGARFHSLETRIRNIVGLISDLNLLRHMGVIDEKRHTSEFGIFKSCAIEFEGLSGTYDNPDGSFSYGSKFVTGEGHVIRKVLRGVKGIGDVVSGGVGIDPIHLFSLYALFGHVKFIQLMKIAFGIVVGDNGMGNFLEKWTREMKRLSEQKYYESHHKKKHERENVKRRAIRELKRQAHEECKDESSKRRRIITDADATQNIPHIRREDARLNHPLIRLLDMKRTNKLYDSIMNDEMLCTLQQYFVEHRVIKPSQKFLDSAKGCMNITPKLITKCVDNIPGLREICNSIWVNTPLSKGSSETAQAIINKYFPEIVE
jgi:hypothetical protein